MEFQYNDGGRSKAGFKGTAGDCVVRAIAIAAVVEYQIVYDALKGANQNFAEDHRSRIAKKILRNGASPREGGYRRVFDGYLKSLGFVWQACMTIGSGCKVHLRAEELPKGRIICRVSKHLVAVIDGVVNDTYNCTRDESRCVYGYYYRPEG